MVLLKFSSSVVRTLRISSLFSSSSGYPSLLLSITVVASLARKSPSMPRVLPCLAALLKSLLKTYPRPSLEGIIPSDAINVTERI